MNLKLENIGIIKEADIKLNGLTVIAGENDSGKSTVGKVLYSLIKTTSISHIVGQDIDVSHQYVNKFQKYINEIFKSQISDNGKVQFDYQDTIFDITIQNDRCKEFNYSNDFVSNGLAYFGPIFIDTPYIWNILPSLKTMKNFESSSQQIDFGISPTLVDLYTSLSSKLKENSSTVKLDIKKIIKGSFEENEFSDFVFNKDNKNIEIVNTAMGIKYFGILQVLSKNNYLFKNQILILDEPEVHLHPKWQLKLAQIIVFLVKNGVKIVVNSHSPYMIEALQRYSEQEQVEDITHFYLAENGMIEKKEDSNSRTLSEIFEKLSEPYDVFDAMDSKKLQND